MKKTLIAVAVLLCAVSFAADAAKSLKFDCKFFGYYKTNGYAYQDGANGKVGAMIADSGWSMQFTPPKNLDFSKTYDIYVLTRGTFDASSAKGFGGFGVYDHKAKKVVGNVRVPVSKINTAEYQRIKICTIKLNDSMYIYVGGVSPKNPANRIFVKEFELVAK